MKGKDAKRAEIPKYGTANSIWKRSTKILFNHIQPFFWRTIQLVTHVTHVMKLFLGGLAMRTVALKLLNLLETAQVELSPSDEKNS